MNDNDPIRSKRMLGFFILYTLLVMFFCACLITWVNIEKVIPAMLEIIQWFVTYITEL